MVPRSAQWHRVVPGRGGADIGVPLNYSQWHRVVPGRGGADIGVPLNYSTTIEIPNTTKIARVGNPGWLVVPRSAQWCTGVPGRGGADRLVPGKGWGRHWVPRSAFRTATSGAEECPVAPTRGAFKYH